MKQPIPEAILANHIAAVGKTGSGKTSTAKLIVEQVVAAGARVCILDPIKSDWWGLISGANGKRAGGLPFKILGGPKGHVPLHSSAGKAIAEIVADGKLPLSIIDMADFEAGGLARFFVDFAPTLLRKARGVIYLVIEEAHLFAPKERSGIGAENMSVHWAKMLATAGRSKGIRLIVATQRTQALHNAILGSCETILAHRLTTPADQKPIVEWLKANVDKTTAQHVADALSSIPTGAAYMCSGEAKIFDLVRFPRISTFDNSATPTNDGVSFEVESAAVDADELRAIIGDAVKEAVDNDPKTLKAEIARLTAAMGKGAAYNKADIDNSFNLGRQKGELAGFDQGYAKGLTQGWIDATAIISGPIEDLIQTFPALKTPPKTTFPEPAAKAHAPDMSVGKIAQPEFVAAQRAINKDMNERAKVAERPAHDGITGPQQRILDALAWWEAAGVSVASRVQVATVARYSAAGSAFKNPLSALKTAGLVDYPNGNVSLTVKGLASANPPATMPTSEELHRQLQGILKGPEWKILAVAIEAFPNAITREELASRSNYSADGSAFKNPLSHLRTLGLVDYPSQGFVVAQSILFVDAR